MDVRGLEEVQTFGTGSQTCSCEGIYIIPVITASKAWQLKPLDVKAAFLQANKSERTVYVQPPKKAETCFLWFLMVSEDDCLWPCQCKWQLK